MLLRDKYKQVLISDLIHSVIANQPSSRELSSVAFDLYLHCRGWFSR